MTPFIRLQIGLIVALCVSVAANAQPATYAKAGVKIKCGVLLIDSALGPGGVPANADPYVFYNLERRADLKPPGWEFENPLASGTITPEMQARWGAIMGPTNPIIAGQKLGKNMAPYWEVHLSKITAEKLSEYDILVIHAPTLFATTIELNSSDREKLRLFMDKGGVLWFDKSVLNVVDAFNGFPIPFAATSAGTNPAVLQPEHPILNYPYRIATANAAVLGLHRGRHALLPQTLAGLGFAGYENMVATVFPDFYKVNPVIVNTAGLVLGIAPVGAGFMVLTASNITSMINEPAGGTFVLGRNSGPIAGEDFYNIPVDELKFAYNLIALSGGHSMLSKGTRRLNSTFDDLGAPLLEAWSDRNLNCDQGDRTNYFPPSIYKGVVFITAGDRLYAYKTDMNRDLDGDGWTDDGLADASLGATRDLVWVSTPLVPPLSSPTCAEVSNPGAGVPRDQVYVIDGQGRLLVFDAFPRSGTRLLGPNPIAPVQTITAPGAAPIIDTSLSSRGPYSPAFFEGLVYVYDTYSGGFGQRLGRVWVVNSATLSLMQSGGNAWAIAGGGAPNLPEPGGALTIGYIPVEDNPAGLDKVLYVTNRSTVAGAPSGVTSIWVGARGESPQELRTANSVNVVTRAAQKGLSIYMPGESSYGLRLYLVDRNTGQPIDAATFRQYFTGAITQFAAGQFQCSLSQPLPDHYAIKVDYHIDWGTGAANLVSSVIRGQIFLPDDISRQRYVQKSMALAPNGNLFVATSNEQNNGTLFCLNEFTRGQFKLVYRWDLHDGFTVTLNNAQTVNIPSAIEDRDDLWRIHFGGSNPYPRLRRLHIHGSPVVINNVCYINVWADQHLAFFTSPGTYILAFDANPTHRNIRLGQPLPAGLRVRQPDIALSTNKANPERSSLLQPNQTEFDFIAGTIRFRNMMSNTNGQMQNGFSTSMPVIVSGNGMPETILDPDATGSKWSPLLWYFGVAGFGSDSPPMVMGNTIYIAGGTVLADILRGRFPPVSRGALFAMDAEIPVNDESIITIPGRPGLKQSRWLIQDTSPLGFHGNRRVRWPSGEGIQSLSDFIIRVEQTLLGANASVALGVIGGDGTLVAWADQGLFGFRRATTVIADEGRIVEVDSAGFARWTSDLTYEVRREPRDTVVQPRPLERPTRAYKTAENEYVVVDTGGSRIVVLDKTAGEVRSIDKLTLDATYRPPGWNEGDPVELRQPRDVAAWGDFVPVANNPFTSPPPTGMEYWVHYLIADTGNKRLIELVDRYETFNDPTTGTLVIGNPVRNDGMNAFARLVWHTPAVFSGKQWQFTAIQRFQIGTDQATGNALFVYVGAIGDMLPTRINTGLDLPDSTGLRETAGGNGGIVIFDNATGQGDQVINEVIMPDATRKRLIGINSLSVRRIPPGDYAIMFTDSTGIYEIVRVANSNNWQVIWAMPNSAYEAVRGVKLKAVSAKRLPNGDILMTNGYFGTSSGAQFFGEVVQWIDHYNPIAPNFGWTSLSVKAAIPPIVGTRGLRNPQFADRL